MSSSFRSLQFSGQPLGKVYPQKKRRVKTPVTCPLRRSLDGGSGFTASDIATMATGPSHALVLTRGGLVYGVGDNSKCQLGSKGEAEAASSMESFQPVTFPIDDGAEESSSSDEAKPKRMTKITQLDTASTFSIFLDSSGSVWISGEVDPDHAVFNSTSPKKLSLRIGEVSEDEGAGSFVQPARVVAGFRRFFIVDRSGALYAAGDNETGALGLGEGVEFASALQKVKVPPSVRDLACGRDHTVVLVTESRVYGMGEDKHGQLGLLRRKTYYSPTAISTLLAKDVNKVRCGLFYTLFLSTKRQGVFVTGRNSQGQLGLGHTRDSYQPTQLFTYRFVKRGNVTDAFCGSSFTLFKTNHDSVYACGKNANGQLGIGSLMKPFQPYLIRGLKLDKAFCMKEGTFFLSKAKKMLPTSGASAVSSMKSRRLGRGRKRPTAQASDARDSLSLTSPPKLLRQQIYKVKARQHAAARGRGGVRKPTTGKKIRKGFTKRRLTGKGRRKTPRGGSAAGGLAVGSRTPPSRAVGSAARHGAAGVRDAAGPGMQSPPSSIPIIAADALTPEDRKSVLLLKKKLLTQQDKNVQLVKKAKDLEQHNLRLEDDLRKAVEKVAQMELNARLEKEAKSESRVSPEEVKFRDRVLKLRKAVEWKMDLRAKHRNFEECLKLQKVAETLKNMPFDDPSIKLVATLEAAGFYLK